MSLRSTAQPWLLLVLAGLVSTSHPTIAAAATLDTHVVSLDANSKLLSWISPQDRAYDRVMASSWDLLLNHIPIDPRNGLNVIFTNSEYDPVTLAGTDWPNNPAGKNAMLCDAARLYYAYSAEPRVLNFARALLDHQLNYGTTPANYDWGNVPWSTAAAGSMTYGNDSLREGTGVLEPDKLGELGYHGYLWMYEVTGETVYRDAAINCADELADHRRTGTGSQSPWPYRVNAQTGAVVENFCSEAIGPIRLFDELIRLNLGNVAAYQTARAAAWTWLMNTVIPDNSWFNYFEDVSVLPDFSNPNQYNAGQTARYLLEHPESDPDWQLHVEGILDWIQSNFGGTDSGELGLQYGARVISEQDHYKYKMASHTSRFAALKALYAEATGDAVAKDVAFHSLNWCTYMCRTNGVVIEGPAEAAHDPACWFTDGHGDYIRHFMVAMGAVPEWAPADESHLLRSSSVVRNVSFSPGGITYATFDAAAIEVLRMRQVPIGVLADGLLLERRADLTQQGWTCDTLSGVVRVRHANGTLIRIVVDSTLDVGPRQNIIRGLRAEPNPGAGPVRIAFVLARETNAEVCVSDVSGRRLRTLVSGPLTAGAHVVNWDGADDSGARVRSGVYHVRIVSDGFESSTQVVRVE